MYILVDIPLFFPVSIIYNLLGNHLFGTKSIPIEVSIVWFCHSNIHAKCVTIFHHLNDMTHHRHSMQRWLSVKQNDIAVHHVSMNNVAIV